MFASILAIGIVSVTLAEGRPCLPLETTALLIQSADPPPPPPGPSLTAESKKDGGFTFLALGLSKKELDALRAARWDDDQWKALFAVYVLGPNGKLAESPLAVAGDYAIDARGGVAFEPRFPPSPGVRYRAILNPARLPVREHTPAGTIFRDFTPAAKSSPNSTTIVRTVFPTSDLLPENQLKFYIHFSAPMARGESYAHVKLLDASGKEIKDVFLELGEELWGDNQTRFTLFFHPGRIKKGLKPREDLGPILEEGKSYTLLVEKTWPDAKGNPLRSEHRKTFKAGPAVEKIIEPKEWRLRPAAAGSDNALTVEFPRPLDNAMLQHALWIEDSRGKRIPGAVAVLPGESTWVFKPDQAWQAGEHALVVRTNLEDLAGNTIAYPFEVDEFKPVTKEIKEETIRIPFRVK